MLKYESLGNGSNSPIPGSPALTTTLLSRHLSSDQFETSLDESDHEHHSISTIFFSKDDHSEEQNELNQHSDVELFGLHEGSTTQEQLEVLVSQSIPVVISFFLGVGGTFINLVFAGNYVHENGDRSTVFAGVSLANMFANVSCLSILIGMSSAVETLGSQHNGAGNFKEVGIVLQRSILILSVITLPIIILWFYTADIFRLLRVKEDVCVVIQNFIRIRSLTIPVDIINESYEKYLMSIGVMRPSMWSNIAFNLFVLLFDLLFVYGLKLEYECLAWSWVISMYLSGIIQIGLSWGHPSVMRTLQPWDSMALTKWGEFVSLGLPGTVMLCSEWWAYEILTIFASLLRTEDVAAQTIILQTASLSFMVPLGLGVATASLVGNALGAHSKGLAIQLGKLALVTIGVLELVLGLSLYFIGPFFVDLFTNEPKVMAVANGVVPFLSVFTMIDGIQGVASGVLRGAGKQFIGAVANILAFYAIGIPMAWVLCFNLNFGVKGLMMGIALGTSFQVVVLVVLIVYFEGYVYSIPTERDVQHTVLRFHTEDHVDNAGALLDKEAALDDESSGHVPLMEWKNPLNGTLKPAAIASPSANSSLLNNLAENVGSTARGATRVIYTGQITESSILSKGKTVDGSEAVQSTEDEEALLPPRSPKSLQSTFEETGGSSRDVHIDIDGVNLSPNMMMEDYAVREEVEV